MESFTLGWLNLVIQALWLPVLEKHLSGLIMEGLQKVLIEVSSAEAHVLVAYPQAQPSWSCQIETWLATSAVKCMSQCVQRFLRVGCLAFVLIP
jgi:hypothetical protein